MVGSDPFVRPAFGSYTEIHDAYLTPTRGRQSADSRINSQGDGSSMHGRTDRANAHPVE